MWTTARNLFHQLTILLGELEDEQKCEEFVKLLRDNIIYIKNPLVNKPKNSSQRSLVGKPGSTAVLGNNQKVIVTPDASNEAIILSDLFNINEVDALELILTGDLQVRNFNTLPRGLCAVVCYYEAHRHFAVIVKTLLRLKSVADELMPSVLINFVGELLNDVTLFKRVLASLQSLSVENEFEKLQKPNVNGLGTAEHQRVLRRCITDLQTSYLEILCIFSYHCTKENQTQCLEALFGAMKQVPLEQDKGYLSLSNLGIWTALLMFINPLKLRHTEDLLQVFRIYKDNLHKKWENPAACASIAWCFSVAVKCARNLPGGFRNEFEIDESKLADTALDNCAFQFIRTCVLDIPNFHEIEVCMDVIDSFVKNFLSYFPEKFHELLNLCEEEIHTLAPLEDERKKPRMYYLKFLGIVARAYNANTPKIQGLCDQFTMPNFIGLENFLRAVRSVASPTLFTAYIDTLTAICKTERVASYCFKLLCSEGDDLICDWNKLFNSLARYCQRFQEKRAYDFYQKKSSIPTKLNPTEISGLITILRLATAIAERDPETRQMFYDFHKWNVIDVLTNVLTEAFPHSLKGEVYNFLAALAIDERASLRIWSFLIGKQLCAFEGKQLVGIQNEFELESKSGNYVCTIGFLKLLNRLLSRKNVPAATELSPFLQFITKSVMNDYTSRQYTDVDQLMIMLTSCIDCLYQLIRHYYVTHESVIGNSVQSVILSELLTDSALNNTLTSIIIGCADRLDDFSARHELREKMSISALRLLYAALNQRKGYVEAVKSCGSSKIVSSLEKLLLSPLYSRQKNNLLAVLLSFINNEDHLVKHTFFVMKILKELCSQRTSLQSLLVSTMMPYKNILQGIFARLTSPFEEEMRVSPVDVPLYDLPDFDEVPIPRLRGEIAKLVIETLIASLESDPCQANITYLLCGFDVNSIGTSSLVSIDTVGESINCIQSLVDIVEIFIARSDPFNVTFSALFEPTLRLLFKFLSFKTESSAVMLRFLRTNCSLIHRLFNSDSFKFIHVFANAVEQNGTAHLSKFVNINTAECTDPIFRRALQGIILQLAAVEVTSLISRGSFDEASKFFTILFGPSNVTADHAYPEDSIVPEAVKEIPLIWALLENSKADCQSLKAPILKKFDNQRIDEILNVCLYENSVGVEQYDVQYLQFLLTIEVQSVITKDVDIIRSECVDLIRYCIRYNARRLLEASCVHLLSGWIAMMNAVAFFSPVHFIDIETQKSYLADALFLLIQYAKDIEFNNTILAAISNSIFRLVTAIAGIISADPNVKNRRTQVSHILATLLNSLVVPAFAKCVPFKLDLYGSIMKIFSICSSEVTKEEDEDPDLSRNILASLLKEQRDVEGQWGAIFSTISEEVTRAISEDINFAPFQLKIVATACLNELIREDVKETQLISTQFVKLGNVKSILMSLESISLDFAYILDTKNKYSCIYLEAIMSLFTELSFAGTVWSTLVDHDVLGRIATLQFWQNVPQGFFTGKTWEINLQSPEGGYATLFSGLIQLCFGLASNPYWKSMAMPILCLIERFQEFTNQLIRSQPEHRLTKSTALLVYYIHELDENSRDIIMKTKCLKDLYQHHLDGGKKKGFNLANPPSRSAFNLPLSLFSKIR